MSKYLIAIDSGSQSSKVVIFDLDGNAICESSDKLLPLNTTKQGFVEHPDDNIWDSISTACRDVMGKFTGDKKDIVGLGLCTIRFCRSLLKQDGTLANPVMSWMDIRVSKPHDTNNKDISYVTASSGYITNKLAGNLSDTSANYLGCWTFNTDTWNWHNDENILKRYNLSKDMLFKLQMPASILGYITTEASEKTHLPLGIPVIATANDKAVEALGAGLYDKNTILVSLGTYIASMVVGDNNHDGTNNFWTNLSSIPNKYLY